MSETYSFVRLRELVEAKVARKLSLQAEIMAIETELREVYTMLSDIPSLERLGLLGQGQVPLEPSIRAQASALFHPVATKKRQKSYRKTVVKVCGECLQERTMLEGNKFCSRGCFSAAQSKRQQAAKDRRLAAEVDRRLA